MRRRVLRKISTLLAWVLGIAACESTVTTPLYGMPSVSFDLDGTVVREGTMTVIPGIEVEFQGHVDTTDANGEWSFSEVEGWACGPDCMVMARDIDGDANGAYQDGSAQFTTTQVLAGNVDWEAHDVEIELTPANDNPNQ